MKRLLVTVLVVLLTAAAAVSAAEPPAELKKALAPLFRDDTNYTLRPSAVPGIYELEYGLNFLYVTADGRYLFRGDLIDLQQGQNLTEVLRQKSRVDLVNAIGEDTMIVFAPKETETKHTITIFTDIDCPYCRKLHKEMAEYNKRGIKIRYLAYPRAGINSSSYEKAVSVWCAKDRNQAMTDAKSGTLVPKKTCDNPVQAHMKAGETLGITGTPTLVLEDGRVLPGYVPADRLNMMLTLPPGMAAGR